MTCVLPFSLATLIQVSPLDTLPIVSEPLDLRYAVYFAPAVQLCGEVEPGINVDSGTYAVKLPELVG
jgi:hypothetical protein